MSSCVVVKARLGDDLRKFTLHLVYEAYVDYMALRCTIRNLFELDDKEFRIKYSDDDDLVSIVTVDDFKECINEHIHKDTTLYLDIVRKPISVKAQHLGVSKMQSSIAPSSQCRAEIDGPSKNANAASKPEEADAEAVTGDVAEALEFVRRVGSKFGGDHRFRRFVKLGAQYHNNKITREWFHEESLALFADDDELMEAFLSAFSEEDTTTARGDVVPASDVTQRKTVEEGKQTDAVDGVYPVVSPLALVYNELQYARLIVQTRIESIFTKKQPRQFQDMRALLHDDIVEVARGETRRRISETRATSGELPSAEDVVAAVVDGLHATQGETGHVCVSSEAMGDVVADVEKTIREVMAEEGRHEEVHGGAVEQAKIVVDNGEGKTESEPQPQPSAVAEEDAETGPCTSASADDTVRGMAVEENSIAEAVIDQAVAAAAAERDTAAASNEDTTPAVDFSAPSVTASYAHVDSVSLSPSEDFIAESLHSAMNSEGLSGNGNSIADSFVMIPTKEEGSNTHSLVSLVMPVPDVAGDDDGFLTECTVSVASQEMGEDAAASESVLSGEEVQTESLYAGASDDSKEPLTYHQKAAALKSSATIDIMFCLHDMGFKNFERNKAVLDDCGWDMQKAVGALVR